jgi:hypothetical protein
MVPGTIHSYTCVFSISTLITIIYQIQRLRAILTRTYPEIVKHTLKPSWHIFTSLISQEEGNSTSHNCNPVLPSTIVPFFLLLKFIQFTQIVARKRSSCLWYIGKDINSSSLFYNNLLYITEWISATKNF